MGRLTNETKGGRLRVGIQGCKILEMSCEDHDRLAFKSQFVSHTISSTKTPVDTKGFDKLPMSLFNT